MNKSLIKIKVINLERRFDRLKNFVIEFEKHNVVDEYERFNAVDGRDLVLDDDIKKLFAHNNFKWRKGVMGCALSHLNIWKELVDSDYKYYLVLEDDINLTENFNKNYAVIKRIITMCEYPLISLGYTTDPKKDINISIPSSRILVSTLIDKKEMWGGTFAYIIHRDRAKNYIDKANSIGIRDPIDVFILSGTGLHETIPQIVSSPLMTLHNGVDSDIQYDDVINNKIPNNILAKYDFYPKLDSAGNDIKQFGKVDINKLVEIADKLEDCIAFNTYGCFKNKILDIDKLTPLPGASIYDGIYIKKNIKDIN